MGVAERERGEDRGGQRSDSTRPAADQDYALLSPQDRLERSQSRRQSMSANTRRISITAVTSLITIWLHVRHPLPGGYIWERKRNCTKLYGVEMYNAAFGRSSERSRFPISQVVLLTSVCSCASGWNAGATWMMFCILSLRHLNNTLTGVSRLLN